MIRTRMISRNISSQRRSLKTQLKGLGGWREEIEVNQRGDKRSHIPNGSLYKCRILRIQGVVIVHLLDFEYPDEAHEDAIYGSFG